MAKKYDEDAVLSLDALAHIRLRPGMYIGRLGDGSHPDDGIYVMLKEVIDNSVDEFIMGNGKKSTIELNEKTSTVSVRDWGRGIPLGKVIECVSQINTGAKYNDDVFQFSVGLNGVGTKAVNALSSHFIVKSIRDGEFVEARFAKGVLQEKKKGKDKRTKWHICRVYPRYRNLQKICFSKRVDHSSGSGIMPISIRDSLLFLMAKEIRSENGLLDLLERRGKRGPAL